MRSIVVASLGVLLTGVGFWAGRQSIDSSDGRASSNVPSRPGRPSKSGYHDGSSISDLMRRYKLDEPILSKEDAEGRLREMFREEDHIKRKAIFNMLLSKANLEEVVAMGEGLAVLAEEGFSVNEYGEPITRRKGGLEGASGLEDKLPKEANGVPNWNVKQRMEGWSTANPAASWEWVQSLEDGEVKKQLTHAWHQGVFLAGSDSLSIAFPNLPEVQQGRLMKRMVEDVVLNQGIEGIPNWYEKNAKNLPPSIRDQAFVEVVTTYARGRRDWKGAVEFMEKYIEPDSKQFADSLSSIVWLTAAKSPHETLDVLNKYAPQNTHLYEAREAYIKNTIHWASTGTVTAVGDWLSGNRDSLIYDDITLNYVRQVQAVDPESARTWAETVKDEGKRVNLLDEIGE